MKHNDIITHIEVNPQTYEVKINNQTITSKSVDKVPLGQLYSLF